MSERTLPDDVVELEIVLLWEELLEGGPIAVTDNFFDIGGTSLAATAMISRLEESLGVPVSLADLLAAQTPQELAAQIRSVQAVADQLIHPLNRPLDPHLPPMYCAHALSGTPLSYVPFARLIEASMAVFGLQAIGVESDAAAVESIPEMAARYSEAVLKHLDGTRQFALLGWSFGTYVAFEMARILESDGNPPCELILIDPLLHDPTAQPDDELERIAPNLWNLEIDRAHYDSLSPDGRITYIIECAMTQGRVSSLMTRETVSRRFKVRRANLRAVDHYLPQGRYAGRVHIMRAVEHDADTRDDVERFWGALAHDLVFTDVPGSHYDILREPHLQSAVDAVIAAVGRENA